MRTPVKFVQSAMALLCAGCIAAVPTPVAAQSAPPSAEPVTQSAGATPSPEANPLPSAQHILQQGTPVKLRLIGTLDARQAKVEEEIPFEIANDVSIDGVIVLRRGTPVAGVVTDAVPNKTMGRPAHLAFVIPSVRLENGETVLLRSFTGGNGDSRKSGVTALVLGTPVAVAPFMLLVKGGNTVFPNGTEITTFIASDKILDLNAFPTGSWPADIRGLAKVRLNVESTPPGADVAVYGVPMCQTPCTTALMPGTYRVVVTKDGYSAWSASVQLSGTEEKVKAVLEEAGPRE